MFFATLILGLAPEPIVVVGLTLEFENVGEKDMLSSYTNKILKTVKVLLTKI